jgi:anthranilate phosphoribosyltransferase
MAAVVAAAAGAPVAKHGNRAASSSSGAADVLEALGVVIDLPAEAVAHCVQEAGIGFFFAPVFHPGMRHAAVPRREMGIGTVFNFLGPLTNPARPVASAIGCADARMAPVLAAVLAARGSRALVFRGDDGLDELTTATTSAVWVVRDGEVEPDRLDPSALGIGTPPPDALRGADAAFNAAVFRRVMDGERGPVRDAVLLNAAGALAAFDERAARLHDALAAGMERAARAVDEGSAAALLDRWIAVSRAARDAVGG